MGRPFEKNDPDGRAAAAGRAGGGKRKRTPEQKEADRRLEQLVSAQPRLPKDFEPPSATEIAATARSFATGALDFAADVLTQPEAQLSDKFQAANLLLRHGASTNAAEQEEINKLTSLLVALKKEHHATVAEMQNSISELRQAKLDLALELEEEEAARAQAEADKAQALEDADLARAEAQSIRIATGKSIPEQRAGLL